MTPAERLLQKGFIHRICLHVDAINRSRQMRQWLQERDMVYDFCFTLYPQQTATLDYCFLNEEDAVMFALRWGES